MTSFTALKIEKNMALISRDILRRWFVRLTLALYFLKQPLVFDHMQILQLTECNRVSLSIVRCNLASVVLQLLAIGVPDVANFDFMDMPSPEVCLHSLIYQTN
jgi:hypothetical protein